MSEKACGCEKFTSSVAKQLLVGVSGLGLVLFILGHLAGNLLIYAGPEAFNAYAHKLQSLGAGLWAMRLGMITLFMLHVVLAVRLWWSNHRARGRAYAVTAAMSDKTIASRLMIYSGIMVFFFVLLHLYDFTLPDKTEIELEIYGLVWSTFSDPLHSLIYIVAVAAVGLHLAHAVSSIWVTLGVLSHRATAWADLAAKVLGAVVFLGFASIPVYVMMSNLMGGRN